MSHRATWTEESERTLADSLLREVQKGKRAENGFKKDSWAFAVDEVNRVHSMALTIGQAKNKLGQLKKKYDTFTALKNNSGFGWDNENAMPTAPDDVWERYMSSHPLAREFRKKPLSNYQRLEELFVGVRATGEYAMIPSILFKTRTDDQPNNSKRKHSNEELLDGTESNSTSTNLFEVMPELAKITANVIASDNDQMLVTTKGTKKRQRKDRGTVGQEIANALTKINETAELMQLTKVQQAVQYVLKEYSEKYTTEEMVLLISIFELEVKSEMFLAMSSGSESIRDAWLESELKKAQNRAQSL